MSSHYRKMGQCYISSCKRGEEGNFNKILILQHHTIKMKIKQLFINFYLYYLIKYYYINYQTNLTANQLKLQTMNDAQSLDKYKRTQKRHYLDQVIQARKQREATSQLRKFLILAFVFISFLIVIGGQTQKQPSETVVTVQENTAQIIIEPIQPQQQSQGEQQLVIQTQQLQTIQIKSSIVNTQESIESTAGPGQIVQIQNIEINEEIKQIEEIQKIEEIQTFQNQNQPQQMEKQIA